MKTKWNTGRLYKENGQIIVAEFRDDGVYFADLSRGVFGVFGAPFSPESQRDLQVMVMTAYDNNAYDPALYSDVEQLIQE